SGHRHRPSSASRSARKNSRSASLPPSGRVKSGRSGTRSTVPYGASMICTPLDAVNFSITPHHPPRPTTRPSVRPSTPQHPPHASHPHEPPTATPPATPRESPPPSELRGV